MSVLVCINGGGRVLSMKGTSDCARRESTENEYP